MKRLPLVLAVLALVAGCSSGTDERFEIGVKRSSVGLVFKEEVKAGPKPNVVDAFAPQAAGPQAAISIAVGRRPILPPIGAATPVCEKARAGIFPQEPVSLAIAKAPRPGAYLFRNSGTVKIEGTASRFEAAVPPQSSKQIKVLEPASSSEIARFDVVQRGAGDAATTTTYRVTASTFDLVRTHTRNARGEATFAPSPPVTVMMLGQGEGTTWNSAGADSQTGTAMVVEGRIEKRENVDVCGKVYDTYRVVSDEAMVNLFTGFRYETDEPTVYNVATHLGGLFLREDVKSTTTIPTAQGDVLVHLDYVSTAMSATPVS